MAGVYIHIPFCKKACHYCNFHFSTSLSSKDNFVASIVKEIELQKDYFRRPTTDNRPQTSDERHTISTIYFGGGTPSILPAIDIELILEQLKSTFNVADDAEITLEANPDDIDDEKLSEWKQIGINRLSIGVQSFVDEDLRWMNRAHTALQAFECIALARDAGFTNITIDLIYGTPTLTDASWERNVAVAVALDIPHISCYALTVEPKTPLHKMIREGKCCNVDTEKQARHFELLMQWMNDEGYEHYEISNFAMPGFRSKHNSSYWNNEPYLGLGPSAHSFNGCSRQWNIANNAQYIQSLADNTVPFEVEELTPQQQLNEYIMTSLRTMEGLSLQKVKATYGKDRFEYLLKHAQPHLMRNHVEVENDFLKTTLEGKLFADAIAADLFVE